MPASSFRATLPEGRRWRRQRRTTNYPVGFLIRPQVWAPLLSMLELFEANFEGPRHSDAACDENLDPTGSDLERYDSSRCQHDP